MKYRCQCGKPDYINHETHNELLFPRKPKHGSLPQYNDYLHFKKATMFCERCGTPICESCGVLGLKGRDWTNIYTYYCPACKEVLE